MEIPLTLGVPPRDAGTLLDGLFDPVAADFVTAQRAAELVATGERPGIAMTEPVDEIADFIAVLAHSSTGFVASADSADDVVAILCATVAALCGDDVRRALRDPQVSTLTALHPDAVAALRDVLVAVRTSDVEAVTAELRERGLR